MRSIFLKARKNGRYSKEASWIKIQTKIQIHINPKNRTKEQAQVKRKKLKN
jgi:hypothetical protein